MSSKEYPVQELEHENLFLSRELIQSLKDRIKILEEENKALKDKLQTLSTPIPDPPVLRTKIRTTSELARLLEMRSYKTLSVIGLIFLISCTNNPKPPDPVPTPTPPTNCNEVFCSPGKVCKVIDNVATCVPVPVKEVKFQNLLLRQNEGNLTRDGKPHSLFGFIPCWDGEEKDHQGWPGISKEGIDYAVSYGANAFHIRLGPFVKDNTWSNGLMYEHSPYLNDDPNGDWDPIWWARVREIIEYAGEKEANVEVDLIDGWACKHAYNGDFQMPWKPEDIEACTRNLTPAHEKWLRKVVEETGCYANVIYQDGNEVGISGRYNPQWTYSLHTVVRKAEAELGCNVVHMFSTNSGVLEVELDSRVDYTNTHKEVPDAPFVGKWRTNNEHNPPYTPEQEHAIYCAVKSSGQAWWFWRGGMLKSDMDKTLALWKSGCEGMGTGSCPFDVPTTDWIKVKPHGTDYYDATPLIKNGTYCRNIGFPAGQINCPVRMEGDPFRFECEIKSMGGRISYNLVEKTGNIDIIVRNQGFGFQVINSGTARVQCFIPNRPGEDICKNGTGGELRISR